MATWLMPIALDDEDNAEVEDDDAQIWLILMYFSHKDLSRVSLTAYGMASMGSGSHPSSRRVKYAGGGILSAHPNVTLH